MLGTLWQRSHRRRQPATDVAAAAAAAAAEALGYSDAV